MYEFRFTVAETDLLKTAVIDYAATLRREFPNNNYAKSCVEMLEDLREQFKDKLYGEKTND